jgi:hypothetical protein
MATRQELIVEMFIDSDKEFTMNQVKDVLRPFGYSVDAASPNPVGFLLYKLCQSGFLTMRKGMAQNSCRWVNYYKYRR